MHSQPHPRLPPGQKHRVFESPNPTTSSGLAASWICPQPLHTLDHPALPHGRVVFGVLQSPGIIKPPFSNVLALHCFLPLIRSECLVLPSLLPKHWSKSHLKYSLNWEIRIDIYTLLHMKQRTNEKQLHRTGKSTQCSMVM